MSKYVYRRLILIVPVLAGISMLTFGLIHIVPGDPALIMLQGQVYTAQDVMRLHAQWGLDRPLVVQYLTYAGHALVGNLGRSFLMQQPVLPIILAYLPATIELALASTVIAVCIALPIGVLSAIRPHTLVDRLGMLIAIFGISMPGFWIGLLLILAFAVNLGWLPASGRLDYLVHLHRVTGFDLLDSLLTANVPAFANALRHLILPAFVLGTAMAAVTTRMVRWSVLNVAHQEYILCARAKGLGERAVILVHILRNALIPAVTVVGMQIGNVLGGAVIVETIFGWPGLGQLTIQTIQGRDYLLLQGIVLFFALTRVSLNLLTDLLYGVIDPRVRYV
jgi:ABC-type dipeptide/oligopeptide/nickel transport system permease component